MRSKPGMYRAAVAACALAATLAATTMAANPALATEKSLSPSGPWPSSTIQSDAVPAGVRADAGPAKIIVCNGTVDTPHYSKGTGGVIFKVRVTCDGPIKLTVNGTLSSGPLSGPPVPRSKTTQTRAMVSNKTETFYTPDVGQPVVQCVSGLYYQGTASFTPAGGTTGNLASQVVQAKCP